MICGMPPMMKFRISKCCFIGSLTEKCIDQKGWVQYKYRSLNKCVGEKVGDGDMELLGAQNVIEYETYSS